MQEILLTPEEASEKLHVSTVTLSQWRWKRIHLPFVKIVRRVAYRVSDIEAFINASTVEPIPES